MQPNQEHQTRMAQYQAQIDTLWEEMYQHQRRFSSLQEGLAWQHECTILQHHWIATQNEWLTVQNDWLLHQRMVIEQNTSP